MRREIVKADEKIARRLRREKAFPPTPSSPDHALDLIFSTFLLSKSLAQPGHAYAALVPEVVFLAWGGMLRCRLQVDTCSVLVPIAFGLDLLIYLLLKAVGYSPSLTGFDEEATFIEEKGTGSLYL